MIWNGNNANIVNNKIVNDENSNYIYEAEHDYIMII